MCALRVQVVGTENEDMPQFKLMLNGMLRCPVTIESLSHHVASGEVLGKLDVFYGRNSFRENTIKSKVNAPHFYHSCSLSSIAIFLYFPQIADTCVVYLQKHFCEGNCNLRQNNATNALYLTTTTLQQFLYCHISI